MESNFVWPVAGSMNNVKNLDCRRRHLIDDDVRQTRKHKLTCASNSPGTAPQGKEIKAVGCIKDSFGNGTRRGGIVSSDVTGNLLKILRGGRRPSHLNWIGHQALSGQQFALYASPDFGGRHKIAPRRRIPPSLNRGVKASFFGQIAIHGLTRQLIRTPASLGGHLGELHFLLVAELNLHGLRLECAGVAVNEDCHISLGKFPRGAFSVSEMLTGGWTPSVWCVAALPESLAYAQPAPCCLQTLPSPCRPQHFLKTAYRPSTFLLSLRLRRHRRQRCSRLERPSRLRYPNLV